MKKYRVVRLEWINKDAPAGESFSFDHHDFVASFMLGRQFSKYLIIKDGYSFKPTTTDVFKMSKELAEFDGAKNTEQANQPDSGE